jgi:hypothetical protein
MTGCAGAMFERGKNGSDSAVAPSRFAMPWDRVKNP